MSVRGYPLTINFKSASWESLLSNISVHNLIKSTCRPQEIHWLQVCTNLARVYQFIHLFMIMMVLALWIANVNLLFLKTYKYIAILYIILLEDIFSATIAILYSYTIYILIMLNVIDFTWQWKVFFYSCAKNCLLCDF